MKENIDIPKAYFQYHKIIVDQATKYIKHNSDDQKEVNDILKNIILNQPGKRKLDKPEITLEASNYFEYFYTPFLELSISIEDLFVSHKYFKSGFNKKMGLSEEDYIRYHSNNFMNELYISKNRIIVLITKIQHYYQINKNDDFGYLLNELKKATTRIFKNIDQVRGTHVHQKRYSDNDIEQINALCLFSKSNDISFLRYIDFVKIEAFKTVRKKWSKLSFDWISNIYKLVTSIYISLQEYIVVNNKIDLNRKRFTK